MAIFVDAIVVILSTFFGFELPKYEIDFLRNVQISVTKFGPTLQCLWILGAFVTLLVTYDFRLAWSNIKSPKTVAPLRSFIKVLMTLSLLTFCGLAFGLQAVIGGLLMYLLSIRRYPLLILCILSILSYLTLQFEEENKKFFYFF